MRKILWVALTVLVAAISAPNAQSQTEVPTFTGSPACSATPNAPNVVFPAPTLAINQGTDPTQFFVTLQASELPTDVFTWSSTIDGRNSETLLYHRLPTERYD